jgi:tRNA(fMet)-specific endonuclease VapC
VILPYDASAAAWHARERARLTRRGKRPAFVDGQIAAIAAVNDLVLVTRNLRDFSGFSGLEIESWFSA